MPQAQTPPAGKANFGERTSTHLGEQGLKGIIALSSERASLKTDMSESRTIRVMLVEDHIAFRQALAFLLMREPDLEVVAQAGSLAQARQMLDTPLDVVVVDPGLPDGDGRDLSTSCAGRMQGSLLWC